MHSENDYDSTKQKICAVTKSVGRKFSRGANGKKVRKIAKKTENSTIKGERRIGVLL